VNLPTFRQGWRVLLASIWPWVFLPIFGCSVPQFVELLRAPEAEGQEGVVHQSWESLRQSLEWKDEHPWDFECYGQLDVAKVVLLG
jgi:hypothetical protein